MRPAHRTTDTFHWPVAAPVRSQCTAQDQPAMEVSCSSQPPCVVCLTSGTVRMKRRRGTGDGHAAYGAYEARACSCFVSEPLVSIWMRGFTPSLDWRVNSSTPCFKKNLRYRCLSCQYT